MKILFSLNKQNLYTNLVPQGGHSVADITTRRATAPLSVKFDTFQAQLGQIYLNVVVIFSQCSAPLVKIILMLKSKTFDILQNYLEKPRAKVLFLYFSFLFPILLLLRTSTRNNDVGYKSIEVICKSIISDLKHQFSDAQ